MEEAAASPKPASVNAKCVVVQGFGGIRQLKVAIKTQLLPEENQVMVRVKACGVSFLDVMVRQGLVDNPPRTPFIPGFDCAGEVEALGEKVLSVRRGDRVLCVKELGTWAEFIVVDEANVFKLPENMDYTQAAGFFFSYVPAYLMLFEIGHLRANANVFAHGLGGGVGQAIVQLCKTVDGVTLIGTASKQKHDILKPMVSHLFDHTVDYVLETKKVLPDGVDLLLDCLAGEDINRGINLLKPLGKYVLYGMSNVVTGETKSLLSFAKTWWQVDKISPIRLYEDNKTISGFQLRSLISKPSAQPLLRTTLERLFTLFAEGKILPVVDSVWAFDDVGEAMLKLHDRRNIGKLVLDPASLSLAEQQRLADSQAVEAEAEEGGSSDTGGPDDPGDAEE